MKTGKNRLVSLTNKLKGRKWRCNTVIAKGCKNMPTPIPPSKKVENKRAKQNHILQGYTWIRKL